MGTQVLQPDIPPPRALSRPKAVRVPSVASMNELAQKRPPRANLGANASTNSTATALGVAVAAGLAATLGGALVLRATRDDDAG